MTSHRRELSQSVRRDQWSMLLLPPAAVCVKSAGVRNPTESHAERAEPLRIPLGFDYRAVEALRDSDFVFLGKLEPNTCL